MQQRAKAGLEPRLGLNFDKWYALVQVSYQGTLFV